MVISYPIMAISIDPKVAFGKPVISGTRISVDFVLELLSSGMSYEEILESYPHLTKQDILDVIEYARKSLNHEEIISLSAEVA